MAVAYLNAYFPIFAKLNLGLRVNLFTLKRFGVWNRANLDSLENISSAFVLICGHLNFRRVKIIHTYISCWYTNSLISFRYFFNQMVIKIEFAIQNHTKMFM